METGVTCASHVAEERKGAEGVPPAMLESSTSAPLLVRHEDPLVRELGATFLPRLLGRGLRVGIESGAAVRTSNSEPHFLRHGHGHGHERERCHAPVGSLPPLE